MADLFSQASAGADFVLSRTPLRPALGIVLGSGLGDFAAQVQDAVSIPYAEIPHFPQSTVPGHAGRLIIGTLAGVPVAVMAGRAHLYEGYTPQQVTFPARMLGRMGVTTLVVTNAAGGIRTEFAQGAIVGIRDHINLTGVNACVGPNDERFGPRFHDMSNAYAPRLLALAKDEAAKQGWELPTGVYLAVSGPSFETPAEIRAFRTMGADLVGMSTVHETIVARHMGIEVLGLSVVTNMAAGVLDQPINHEEVIETGKQVTGRLSSLLLGLIPQIDVLGR